MVRRKRSEQKLTMGSNYKQFFSDEQYKKLNDLLKTLDKNSFTITLSSGVKKGDNFCGIIIDVKIKWIKGEEASTSHLTVKVIPVNEILHKSIPVKACFEREIYFYTKVFPELEKFQNEKKIRKLFKCYPDFYRTEPQTDDMLVFKNMKESGYKHANRNQPLDYNHIIIVIKEYAKLHALSLAIREQKPKLFEEFTGNLKDNFFKKFEMEAISSVAIQRIRSAQKSLDPVYDQVVYKNFSDFFRKMFPLIEELTNQTNSFSVISHIDTGISNLLFNYKNQSDIPAAVSILDWQVSRLASPAVDLTTFIFSATDKDLRTRYNDIILEYYKTLSSFLEELGSDAKDLLPFEMLQRELKTYSIIGLFLAIHLIYVYTTPQTPPDIVHDHCHKDGSSFVYELENSSEFDQRVRDAIIDFDRFGYNFC